MLTLRPKLRDYTFRIKARLPRRAFAVSGLFLAIIGSDVQGGHASSNLTPTGGPSSLSTTAPGACSGVCQIGGGTRVGQNLFHSFQTFDVGTGDTAQFTNTHGVPGGDFANILSRVTGGASTIMGTVDAATNFPAANLFLFNPSGVVLGPGAVMNVGGAVNISTANELNLTDGTNSFAFGMGTTTADLNGSAGLLSVASVESFGFTGANPPDLPDASAAIEVQGLDVKNGSSLFLVGRDAVSDGKPIEGVEISGSLADAGGRVVVGSVASQGNAEIVSSTSGGPRSDLNLSSFSEQGQVVFPSGSSISTKGTASSPDGGAVVIRAGQLTLTGSAIATSPVSGSIFLPSSGAGGGVTIEVNKSASIKDSTINTESKSASGTAGSVTVTASGTGSVSLVNTTINTQNDRGGGDGGGVTLVASQFDVEGGEINTGTRAGFFGIGAGNAGPIEFGVGVLSISGGATITAKTSGSEKAGPITVRGVTSAQFASNVTLSGSLSGSATTISSNASGGGGGGDIIINTKVLKISGKAAIQSTSGTGLPGGDITITASETITVSGPDGGIGGHILANAIGDGGGGNITLTAPEVVLENQAIVTAKATGTGDAGNIVVGTAEAPVTSLKIANSQVSTESTSSSGGSIEVNAISMVRLDNSSLSTSVTGPEGSNGGNIVIDPEFVILRNSSILAQAIQGRGGNINITTGVFLQDANSVVDASSQFGISGNVAIQSPLSNLSEALAPLPESLIEAAALLRARCAARLQGGRTSSFVQRGRDGIPGMPGGFLPGPVSFNNSAQLLPLEKGSSPRIFRAEHFFDTSCG